MQTEDQFNLQLDAGEEDTSTAADEAAGASTSQDESKEAALEAPKTLVEEPGDSGDPVVATEIPENWRELLAGEDQAALSILRRLKSFGDLGKKLVSQEQFIRSAQHKQPLPDNATEEQIAAYREANGIPANPAGYLEQLEGLVVGDEDLPMIQSFLESSHAQNAPSEFVSHAINWYYELQTELAAQQAQQDADFRLESHSELKEQMGPDFVPNMRDLKAWLSTEDGLFDRLMSARLDGGSGHMLGDDPGIIDFLVRQMREINPAHSIVGGSGSDIGKTVDEQIASLEAMMRTPEGHDKYWSDPKLQTRYSELLAAKERIDQRKVA